MQLTVFPLLVSCRFFFYSLDLGLKKWIHKWKKNDWKSASGTTVKNEEIIRCIDSNLAIRSKLGQLVRLRHVKGHSGEVGNEGADSLANLGTLKPLIPERDWTALEAQLERELNDIDPNTVFDDPMEIQGSIDPAESIPLEIQTKPRKLGDVVVLFDNQPDMALSHSHPKANSSGQTEMTVCGPPTSACNKADSRLQNKVAGQEPRTPVLDKLTTTSPKAKSLSRPNPGELRKADEEALVSSVQTPFDAPVFQPEKNSKKPMAVSETSQESSKPTTHGFHANSSTQSLVKVLYVAPPLVPVPEEDVNFAVRKPFNRDSDGKIQQIISGLC